MSISIRAGYLFVLVLALVPTAAAEEHFQVTTLAPDLLMLSTDRGSHSNNALIFTGPDGVLLVDTHADQDPEELKQYVENLGFGPPGTSSPLTVM